jgi:hypothetical protein
MPGRKLCRRGSRDTAAGDIRRIFGGDGFRLGAVERPFVDCRATIKVRIPVNQDEKVSGAWAVGRA